MFKYLSLIVATLGMLALPVTPTHADSEAKLDRWIEVTQMRDLLQGVPEAMMRGLGNGERLSPNLPLDAVEELARKHFAAEVLTRDIRRFMSGKLSDDILDSEIAFYQSELGRKIIAMEAYAADPALKDQIDAEGARIYAEMVETGAPRVAMIERMFQAAGALEWSLAAGMNVGYAMLTAVFGDRMSEEQILAALNANVSDMRARLVKNMTGETAWTYRDMTDAEFERYVSHYETPQGRAVNQAFLDASRIVMVERSRAFGHDLRVLMGQRKS